MALREALHVEATHPIFVPSAVYTRGGKRVAVHLMEGYAFVATGLSDTHYYALERDSPYVKQVLSSGAERRMRTLSTLPNASVEEMREQLRQHVSTDLDVGMITTVTQGVFAHLEAEVMDLDGEHAVVCIELRSIKFIKRLPRVFLDPSSEQADE